jgi:hypothetical protein
VGKKSGCEDQGNEKMAIYKMQIKSMTDMGDITLLQEREFKYYTLSSAVFFVLSGFGCATCARRHTDGQTDLSH